MSSSSLAYFVGEILSSDIYIYIYINPLFKFFTKGKYENLECATLLKMNLFVHIFEGFCLKVSGDFFHTTRPCIFVARKFYIRRNNNKVHSVETGHIVIAHLLP